MVAMELQKRQGKLTNQECELLSCDLAGLGQLLELKLEESNLHEGEIPEWISRRVSAWDTFSCASVNQNCMQTSSLSLLYDLNIGSLLLLLFSDLIGDKERIKTFPKGYYPLLAVSLGTDLVSSFAVAT